jgi:hypothetical protein
MSREVSNQRAKLEGAKSEEDEPGQNGAESKRHHRSCNDRLILLVSSCFGIYGFKLTSSPISA